MQKSSYKQRRLFLNEKKKKKKVSYLLSQYVMYFKIEKRSKRQQVKIYCPYLCYYESLRLKKLSCPMLTSFYSILSHIRLLNPAIRNQEGEEIPINSDQHWIYKSFFAQPKELPMGYCIIISPPSPPPPGLTRGLNFSSYTLLEDYWKLHSPGLMTSIKYGSALRNLVKNESLIHNAKNSIFFYSISRHIVNFYNLPVTLNNPIKCNNPILLSALFFFLGHGRIDRYLVWIIILPWPWNHC